MKNIIVSACLLGENCRYDGKTKVNKEALKLYERYNVIPVCPETLGGLNVPRTASERRGEYAFTKDGADVTAFFIKGAEKTLEKAQENNCLIAVLKERSPSCGNGFIYSGNFDKRLIRGNGFAAELLKNNGIKVLGESEIHTLL